MIYSFLALEFLNFLKSKKSRFNEIRSGKVGFEIEKLIPINRPGISVRLTFSDDRIQTDFQSFTISHAFTCIERVAHRIYNTA